MSASTAAGRADPPPPGTSPRRPLQAAPPLATASDAHHPCMPCPEAEKKSGMSLTKRGGGSVEWSDMNSKNKRAMEVWRKSTDRRVNKGKTEVGVPMIEVPVEMPRV